MSQIFGMSDGFKVADGTIVRPLLNPLDQNSGLEPGGLDEFSIAVGDIRPGQWSRIQVHPVVTLVTVVVSGMLEVTIKDRYGEEPFTAKVSPVGAALVEPGTFLQLHNPSSDDPCQVLYVVSPPYIAQIDESGTVVYEDSISLPQTWEELAALDWLPPEVPDTKTKLAARREAERVVRGGPAVS